MIKRKKKPNLSTFMDILEKDGRYTNGYTEAWMTSNGYFYVRKEGITKMFYTSSDAWRSI